jgi:hypothetical protein
MDLTETGWVGIEWLYPDQDRKEWRALANTAKILGSS